MRDFTHYVVTSNSGVGLNYDVSPLSRSRDLPAFPQRIARWSCDGPYLIAWGHTVMTHKPLPDKLFLPTQLDRNAINPIGNWIRSRRNAKTSILLP